MSILARGDTGHFFEMTGKVALIGKAGLHGNFCNRSAGPQEMPCAMDAYLFEISVRWQAGLGAKDADEVVRAKAGNCRDFIKADVFCKVALEVLTNEFYHGFFITYGSFDRPVVGVLLNQVGKGPDEAGLPFERGPAGLKTDMETAQHGGGLRVIDGGLGKKGDIAGAPDQLGGRLLQEASIEIKHAEAPSLLIGALPGMRFVRVKEHDPPDGRSMHGAAVVKAFCPFFNHTDGCALVGVAGKRVLDVAGVEQLDIANIVGAPYFGVFALMKRVVMAFHGMAASPGCYSTRF